MMGTFTIISRQMLFDFLKDVECGRVPKYNVRDFAAFTGRPFSNDFRKLETGTYKSLTNKCRLKKIMFLEYIISKEELFDTWSMRGFKDWLDSQAVETPKRTKVTPVKNVGSLWGDFLRA